MLVGQPLALMARGTESHANAPTGTRQRPPPADIRLLSTLGWAMGPEGWLAASPSGSKQSYCMKGCMPHDV